MSDAAGRTATAADLPADAPSPDQRAGLTAMFDDCDRHGFHGGNPLVPRTILQRDPRSVADYIKELGQRASQTAARRERRPSRTAPAEDGTRRGP